MKPQEKRRALFLDRDGVINHEYGYVHRPEDFEFKDGIFELCRAAQHQGFLIIVVTNQAGIARGYYTEADFLHLTGWMSVEFEKHDIMITRVYYCPFHPVHGIGKYKSDSPDRKPNPGMLFRARDEYNISLVDSILIGDKVSDIDSGITAGIGTNILLSDRAIVTQNQGLETYRRATSLQEIIDIYFPKDQIQ